LSPPHLDKKIRRNFSADLFFPYIQKVKADLIVDFKMERGGRNVALAEVEDPAPGIDGSVLTSLSAG
jgi:hypothetical protein